MDAKAWWEANAHRLGTDYERLFFQNVLARLDEFDFEFLTAQGKVDAPTSGVHESSTPYYVADFIISEPPDVRIAIEIEGWDKTGEGSGESYQRFKYRHERTGNLHAAGYPVLPFANAHVTKRPDECRRVLQLVLERERARRAQGALDAREERELESLTSAREAELEAARAEIEAKHAELEAQRREVAGAEREAMALREEAEELMRRAETERTKAQDARRQAAELQRTRSMAGVGIAIGVIALVAAVAIPVAVSRSGNDTSPEAGSSCDQPLPWDVAGEHVGSRVALEGPVVSTHFASESNGRPTYLNVGEAFSRDSDKRLTVVIWGQNRNRFERPPDRAFADERICVRGLVELFRGLPQIEVRSPAEIEVL